MVEPPPGGSAPSAPAVAGGGARGGGGFALSPEMRQARAQLRQACAADLQRLCPGLAGRDAFMCLREKSSEASQACGAALARMPHRGGGGGQAGGGGDGAGQD